mmetsp:Transcript_13674/g.33451  ORF Transcript_13674/g.33451 Transcript_13674/m.33451 type:complete len:86 (+) Transcript_13674:393-650(+)
MTKAYNYLMNPARGWDGDAAADGVREPAPEPTGEAEASGPDWGGYHWAAEFYGLGQETEFGDNKADPGPGFKRGRSGRGKKSQDR